MNSHWLCAVGGPSPQDQYDTQQNAAQDKATVDGKTVCLFYQGEILYCIIFFTKLHTAPNQTIADRVLHILLQMTRYEPPYRHSWRTKGATQRAPHAPTAAHRVQWKSASNASKDNNAKNVVAICLTTCLSPTLSVMLVTRNKTSPGQP